VTALLFSAHANAQKLSHAIFSYFP